MKGRTFKAISQNAHFEWTNSGEPSSEVLKLVRFGVRMHVRIEVLHRVGFEVRGRASSASDVGVAMSMVESPRRSARGRASAARGLRRAAARLIMGRKSVGMQSQPEGAKKLSDGPWWAATRRRG